MSSFVDEQSGVKFGFDLDFFNDIKFEDSQVYFEVDVPSDIPSNNLYTLEFETQNGYKYVPDTDCANSKVFIQQ
ncbi:hypothetical protein QQ008_20250 [Fulvivirgaceae bacterium BMA10]|uniref:Uncharacterized protein n=1 Tax=Splendidivirga corallicola TaxID=3051826 RepID=A0ABT8KVT4_9BACT|nr:hypothetical protein [Fulvivirgaceae bacterium BMA10]